MQYVLEGSVRRDADKVRITAQLIRVSDQTQILSREYDRELHSVLAVQGEIAQEISDEIQTALGSAQRGDAAAPSGATPTAFEAYDDYLKGRYFWNKRTAPGFEQAALQFQQSMDKDPELRAFVRRAGRYLRGDGGILRRPPDRPISRKRGRRR